MLYSADAFAGLISIDPILDSDSTSLNLNQSAQLLSEVFSSEATESSFLRAESNQFASTDPLESELDGSNHLVTQAHTVQLFDESLDEVDYEFNGRQEIIFIDSATPDYETLLEGRTDEPNTHYRIVVLDSSKDGVEQISNTLQGLHDIDAIHLVSHGNNQGLQLGNTWLASSSVDVYTEQLRGWSSSLSDNADLLIYGCKLASDNNGQLLINQLAELTTADIAASDDLTGAASLGGDWELEHKVGEINTSLAFDEGQQSNFAGVLDTFTVNTTTDTIDANPGDGFALDVNGNTSLRAAIMEANALAGSDSIVLPSGTYTLSLTGADENQAVTGDLDVSSELSIVGAGASNTRIDADNIDRVFDIHAGATLSISGVKIAGGSALSGAGINNAGTLTIEDSAITSNVSVGFGGGLHTVDGSSTTVNRVEISGNDAVQGGGVYVDSPDSNFTNTTISTNTAAEGAGVFVSDNVSTFLNATIVNNTSGGGASGIHTDATGSATLQNTLLDNAGDNLFGTIISTGYNIDTNATSELSDSSIVSDQINVTIDLGPLAINGGETQTHALLAGPGTATAINHALMAGAPTTDQRGLTRDATPDIGAYEAANDQAPIFTDTGPFDVVEGTAIGVLVGDINANDGDGGAADDGINYTLPSNPDLDGDGNFAFGINSITGVITVTDSDDLDFEATPQLSVTVQADDGELTTTTNVFLNLLDEAPTVSAVGAAEVNAGEPYALNLTVTEPGTSGITSYTVNWGDGNVDVVPYSDLTTITEHIYAGVGFTYNITFTAHDVSANYTNSDLVTTSWRSGDEIFIVDGNTGDVIGTFEDAPNGSIMNKPYGIVVGPDGNFYVSGVNSDSIVRYAPDGTYLNLFASNGELDQPAGLAWGADGNLYVANKADDNILRYDAAGNFIDIWGEDGPLDSPEDIVFGPDGNLYISDSIDDHILMINGSTGGQPSIVVENGLNYPEQLVFDAAGNLYIANGDDNNVAVWDSNGTSLTAVPYFTTGDNVNDLFTNTEFEYGSGVALGPDGQLYAVGYRSDSVVRTDDGVTGDVFVPDVSSGGIIDPSQLAFTPDQQVTITENTPTTTSSDLDFVHTYNEGDATFAINTIIVSDSDVNEIITANLTLANTAAGSLSSNNGATYDGNTGVWSIEGTVDSVNLALANIEFSPSPNNDVNTSINVEIDDGDGDGSGPLSGTVSLNVIAVNDLPTATNLNSNAIISVPGDNLPLPDIVVSDVDTDEQITATLDFGFSFFDFVGELTENDGANFSRITGIWSITGTVDEVNTALENVEFNPFLNNSREFTIDVIIDDDDNSGPLTGTISVIDSTPNAAPTATDLDSVSQYAEGDASVDITDIVVADGNLDDTITSTLTLADTNTGTLSSNDGASYDVNTGIWSISSSIENVNDALENLVFIPSPDNDKDTIIHVEINDADGAGPLLGTIELPVIAVNDAPTATNLNGNFNYIEDQSIVGLAGIIVSDVDTDEEITANLTLLDVSAGTLSANDGATYDALSGQWVLTDSVENINFALANLEFYPAENNERNTSISVAISDGNENGITPLLGNISLIVITKNDLPSATSLNSVLNYDEGELIVPISDIVVSDPDTDEVITATLQLEDISTGSLSIGDGADYDELTGIWSITDTVTNVNIALANVEFYPQPENDLDTNISINIEDDEGDTVSPTTGNILLDVNPVNDAPAVSIGSDEIDYVEGANSVSINGFSITDTDNAETVTATLVLTNVSTGSISSTTGGMYTSDTGVWTITGEVTEVNNALANVVFIPAPGNTEDTTISVSIDDGDEDASGPVERIIKVDVALLPPELQAAEPDDLDPVDEEETTETPEPEATTGETPKEDTETTEEPSEEPAEESIEEQIEKDTITDEFDTPRVAEIDMSIDALSNDFKVVLDNVDSVVEEKVTRITVYKPTAINILKTDLSEQLNLLDDPLQYIGSDSFVNKLDSLREELDSETKTTDKIIGSSMTATAGLSVGYVIWMARSGILLSSALSSLPAWRFIDPLPVLGSLHSDDSGDDESLESMVSEQDDSDEWHKENEKDD